MKLLTFAAGLAAGYVLGTRAGRERFEQLTDEARKLTNHPKMSKLQDTAKQLLGGSTDPQPSVTNHASAVAVPVEPGPDAATLAESVPQRRPRRRPGTAAPGTVTESPA